MRVFYMRYFYPITASSLYTCGLGSIPQASASSFPPHSSLMNCRYFGSGQDSKEVHQGGSDPDGTEQKVSANNFTNERK